MSALFIFPINRLTVSSYIFPCLMGHRELITAEFLRGIIYVVKYGHQRKDAPSEYGSYKTLYNRFIRWSRLGFFNKILAELIEKQRIRSD